jgi:Domain of unknown function (DUF1996)
MAFDDPIVFPGQPGSSHLHTFFGNTALNASTTSATIASTGNSTCHGGTLNRSGYWVASIIDTATGIPVVPDNAMFYYKLGYRGVQASQIKTQLPPGLRMIAGDAKSSMSPSQWSSPYRWHCANTDGSHSSYGFTIPNCAPGAQVALEVWMPQCWDGVNLDSPDHKSHMAYGSGGCPSTHPVALPEISLNIAWRVPQGGSSTRWRLSSDTYDPGLPAGYSAHADWFNGWKPEASSAFVNGCVRASRDCHAHLLGDGQAIF